MCCSSPRISSRPTASASGSVHGVRDARQAGSSGLSAAADRGQRLAPRRGDACASDWSISQFALEVREGRLEQFRAHIFSDRSNIGRTLDARDDHGVADRRAVVALPAPLPKGNEQGTARRPALVASSRRGPAAFRPRRKGVVTATKNTVTPPAPRRACRAPMPRQQGTMPPRRTGATPRHALEFAGAAVAERDARADHEVLYRARDDHLVRAGERADTCADVDGHPADVVADELALAGVQARSQLDVQRSHLIRDQHGHSESRARDHRRSRESRRPSSLPRGLDGARARRA